MEQLEEELVGYHCDNIRNEQQPVIDRGEAEV